MRIKVSEPRLPNMVEGPGKFQPLCRKQQPCRKLHKLSHREKYSFFLVILAGNRWRTWREHFKYTESFAVNSFLASGAGPLRALRVTVISDVLMCDLCHTLTSRVFCVVINHWAFACGRRAFLQRGSKRLDSCWALLTAALLPRHASKSRHSA